VRGPGELMRYFLSILEPIDALRRTNQLLELPSAPREHVRPCDITSHRSSAPSGITLDC